MATETNQVRDELFLLALKEKLPNIANANLKQVVNKVGKEKFEDTRDQVFAYLERSCGRGLTRNETLAILSQVFKCYTHYLEGTLELPVTLNTVMGNVHLISHSVNRSFPGYAEAGVLRAVIMPDRVSQVAA